MQYTRPLCVYVVYVLSAISTPMSHFWAGNSISIVMLLRFPRILGSPFSVLEFEILVSALCVCMYA